MNKIEEYIYNVGQALMKNYTMFRTLYYSKEGCLKLARDIGYGLADFTQEERNGVMGSIYGIIAVKLYDLKPFVNSKEFYTYVGYGLNDAFEYKKLK